MDRLYALALGIFGPDGHGGPPKGGPFRPRPISFASHHEADERIGSNRVGQRR